MAQSPIDVAALWWSCYSNAAERLFNKKPGEVLSGDEDDACTAAALAELDAELDARGVHND
jgi:hypothetical protein